MHSFVILSEFNVAWYRTPPIDVLIFSLKIIRLGSFQTSSLNKTVQTVNIREFLDMMNFFFHLFEANNKVYIHINPYSPPPPPKKIGLIF